MSPDARRTLSRRLIVGGALCLAIGFGQKLLLPELVTERYGTLQRLFNFQQGAFKQLGLLAFAWGCLGLVALRLDAPDRVRAVERLAAKLLFSALVFLAAGEVATRLLFLDGASFSSRAGPLVRRFERDFRFNCHSEPHAPSRGPDACDAAPGGTTILVQGDSITWGQGVRDETALYTSRLLARLRRDAPRIELAVVAQPGREIDGHLEALRRHGPSIRPDAIVYQWCRNDLELDKSGRPSAPAPWRRLFVHELLQWYSAFWFFADAQLVQWASRGEIGYPAYMRATYEGGTPQRERFERVFADWVEEARRHTDRILVVLHPVDATEGFELDWLHRSMIELCRRHGIEVLDFREHAARLGRDPARLFAGRFDNHPSAEVHAIAAEAIHREIAGRWPELVGR